MSKEKKDKKSKKKAPKESYYEAIVSYKIGLKKQELELANQEFNKIYELNRNMKKTNERLAQTKDTNVHHAVEQYRSDTNNYRVKQHFNKEDVLAEMKGFWKWREDQEKEAFCHRREIRKTDLEISDAMRELNFWIEFRDTVTHELDFKIRLLKKELADMNENYEIISEYLKQNLVETVENIKKNTEATIENNNQTVAERAFKRLEKEVLVMSRDNNWMREKLALYQKEMDDLNDYTTILQNENIKLMKYLFECNNEELKTVKNAFQTQFFDDDNVETNSIMDVDLNQLNSVRPNSSLKHTMKRINEMNLNSDRNKTLAIAYGMSGEDRSDSYRASSKTLCLVGEKKSVYKPKTPSNEELDAQVFTNCDEWPITQEMLKEALDKSL